MTFTVTYRDTDGAVREECVEAASRSACFAQMRARGVTVLGAREGAGHQSKHASPKHSNTFRPSTSQHLNLPSVIIAFVALAIAGGGAWWWMAARSGSASYQPEAPKKPSALAKEVKSVTTPKSTAPKPAALAKAPKAEEAQKAPARPTAGPPPGTVLSMRTNDNNLVISEVVQPDGSVRLETKALHPPVFANLADQLIAAAMNASMTGQMPPMPLGPETDWQFKAALKKPILDNPDDSDEVKRMKQVVRETREQIAGLMEQGHSFAEILADHRELWNENIKIRNGVVTEYRKIVRSGDEEGARRYFTTMNTALGQMGIPPLTENDGFSRRRRARKAEENEH